MKRILSTLSQKWPEYLLEVLVITAGIIGAFMLNSWKENRQEIKSETKALYDLREEFRANREVFLESVKWRELSQSRTRRVIEHLKNEEFDSLVSIGRSWIGGVSTNFSHGVIESLINSGNIALIQNDTLKYALTNWREEVADVREDEIWHIEFIFEVERLLSAKNLFLTEARSPGNSYEGAFSDYKAAKASYASHAQDTDLHGVLLRNLNWNTRALGEYEELLIEFDRIQGMIENELDKRK